MWIQPGGVSRQLPAKSWSVCAEDCRHHWYLNCLNIFASCPLLFEDWYYDWLLMILHVLLFFRPGDTRHQQHHRCPGQNHRWTEHPYHPRDQRCQLLSLNSSVIFVRHRHVYSSLSLSSLLCLLGTYIRTSDGRIFAVRAANKPKRGEETVESSLAKSKII